MQLWDYTCELSQMKYGFIGCYYIGCYIKCVTSSTEEDMNLNRFILNASNMLQKEYFLIIWRFV